MDLVKIWAAVSQNCHSISILRQCRSSILQTKISWLTESGRCETYWILHIVICQYEETHPAEEDRQGTGAPCSSAFPAGPQGAQGHKICWWTSACSSREWEATTVVNVHLRWWSGHQHKHNSKSLSVILRKCPFNGLTDFGRLGLKYCC